MNAKVLLCVHTLGSAMQGIFSVLVNIAPHGREGMRFC